MGTFPVLCCLNSDTSHGVWAQRLSVSQNLRPKRFGREWIFFSPLQKMCCTILNIEVKWSDFRDERRYAVPVFLNRNLSLSGTPFCVDDDRHYAKLMESMNCVSLNQSQRKKNVSTISMRDDRMTPRLLHPVCGSYVCLLPSPCLMLPLIKMLAYWHSSVSFVCT